jgi:predicted ester cyclase
LRAGVPDLTVTVEDQIADGDKVATRWTAQGTHDGELMGIDPTRRTAVVTGITVQRIGDGGQIVEGWTNWDMLGMLQQLGIAPQPAVR